MRRARERERANIFYILVYKNIRSYSLVIYRRFVRRRKFKCGVKSKKLFYCILFVVFYIIYTRIFLYSARYIFYDTNVVFINAYILPLVRSIFYYIRNICVIICDKYHIIYERSCTKVSLSCIIN